MRTTKPYLIAEMGVNFYDTARVKNISPLAAAKLYIDAAAEAGIDCAKFQSYKAGTIVSKNSPAYWDTTKEPTKTQYELFLKHDHFGEAEYRELCEYTHAKGMILRRHRLTMLLLTTWKTWLISIRSHLPTFLTYLLLHILQRKGNPYICLLEQHTCLSAMKLFVC